MTTAVAGDERFLLVALRRKLAAQIDAGCPAAVLAPLVRQLRDIDTQIREHRRYSNPSVLDIHMFFDMRRLNRPGPIRPGPTSN